jgi:hypothetical protein
MTHPMTDYSKLLKRLDNDQMIWTPDECAKGAAAIRNLQSQLAALQARVDGEGDAGISAAAKWHEDEADLDRTNGLRTGWDHHAYAKRIRALTRKGEGE